MHQKELIFATHNANKAREIQQLLGAKFKVKILNDVGIVEEIPEVKNTIKGNASQKSLFVFNRLAANVFSDDTGLEVSVLDGAPGVYSARYAGPQKNSADNINLLLLNLKGKEDRSAQFRTVISLFWEGKEYFFEGIVKGKIALKRRGDDGFGYDPIFLPDGYSQTFSEMSLALKNKISHRGLAIQKMILFLSA